jgi:predicted GIY-YIG superfamily endonuclease
VEDESKHLKYRTDVPGWVYVMKLVDDGKDCWYVGSTTDINRRLKEHSKTFMGIWMLRGTLYSIIPCSTAAKAYMYEQMFHSYPYHWDEKILKWIVTDVLDATWEEQKSRWLKDLTL